MAEAHREQPKGSDEYGYPAYPHSLIHDGWLHVIVSRDKNKIEVLRVALSELSSKGRKTITLLWQARPGSVFGVRSSAFSHSPPLHLSHTLTRAVSKLPLVSPATFPHPFLNDANLLAVDFVPGMVAGRCADTCG